MGVDGLMASLFDMGFGGYSVGTYKYPISYPTSYPSGYTGTTLSSPTGITAVTSSPTVLSGTSTSGGTSTATSGGTTSGPAPLTSAQQNAYTIMQGILGQVGLGDLASVVLGYIRQGYTDSNAIEVLLQQTPEWQQRFAGNEALKKAGLPELSVADYLNTEAAYSQTLHQFGIPAGMYGRSDFANWIGKSVSASELGSRLSLAQSAALSTDSYFKNALSAMGVDTGHLTAYFVDPDKALPYLQRQEQASFIGAEALRQHLNLDPNTALALASMGITTDQARSGYAQIANEMPRLQALAGITPGGVFNQKVGEAAQFSGNTGALQDIFHLENTEEARFSGFGAVGGNIYHPAYGLSTPLQGQY